MTPQPVGREALTSYQLQGASSHPASLQGHNNSERHINHSTTCTSSLSQIWFPSPKSGRPGGCPDFLFSYHIISSPLRKPFCPSLTGDISPRNWALTRKSRAAQGPFITVISQQLVPCGPATEQPAFRTQWSGSCRKSLASKSTASLHRGMQQIRTHLILSVYASSINSYYLVPFSSYLCLSS